MKTKILIGFISFIFLLAYSLNVFASINEDIENIIIEDVIEEEKFDNPQEDEENYQIIDNKEIEVIEEISENISIQEIEVGTSNYKGTMWLDFPSNNSTYIRPDIEIAKFSGWAVSNDNQATVKMYVDGNFKGNCSRFKRADVDVIISPGYGGAGLTPNAGFSYNLNINELSVGTHIIKFEEQSRYGEILASNQVQINVLNKNYNGAMYIDSPTNGSSFVIPDINKVKVSGWAVSNDSQSVLKIYVNNVYWTNIKQNVNRPDLKQISANYGNVTDINKAGFNYDVDISDFFEGEHTIRIDQVSRFGNVISSASVKIKVKKRNYTGAMYIDSPTNGSSFVIPDKNKVKVSGWAVSDDSQSVLKIYVNNVYWTNIKQDINRPDLKQISANYGNVTDINKAGFNYDIDISTFPLGEHTIRIDQVSRYGKIISSFATKIKVTPKKYIGEVYIDTPNNNSTFIKQDTNQINLEGWSVSNDSNSTVRILFDGSVIANTITRIKRTDVDTIISPSYGGINNTPNAGFKTTIDISGQPIGNHKIRVEEISRYGEIISSSEIIINLSNHKYLGEMCLDDPKINNEYEVGKNLIVSGWAVAEDENAYIEIYIDGILKSTGDRYYRADIIPFMNKYGNKTINAGFGKLISTSGLSAGIHKLTVYEKSRYGDIIGGIERNFVIKSNQVVSNSNTIYSNSSSNSNTNNTYSNIPSVSIKTSGTMGIDVSQFQGNINWASVSQSGVKYAMIRIGYRGYGTGGFAEDTKFKTNFANAVANGIKVGVYFYSTSINTTEAKKDAEYVMQILKKYGYQNQVSMPIAIDLELVSGVNTRDINVSRQTRTNIANTFCNTIASYGYTPMIYACKSFLNDNMYKNQLLYDVWVAQYSSNCTYSGKYTIWQYTSSGKISGISGNVDCNYCYKNY